MKNFNRCDSHGHHGSKRCELVQHTHSHGSHAFIHTLTLTQLQPHGVKRQLSYYFSVYAGSFGVSVIHQTLTWTTGSLSCVLIILVHACTHGGWTHRQQVSRTFLTRKNSLIFHSILRPLDPSPTLYQLSHPITAISFRMCFVCFLLMNTLILLLPSQIHSKSNCS